MSKRKRGPAGASGPRPAPPVPTPPPDPPRQAKRAEQENLEDIIARAAARAAQEAERVRREQEAATVLHNTVLLMENYRQLKAFPDRAISEAGEAGLGDGQTFLRSIRESRAKTMIMLAHLDESLQLLESEAAQSGTAYKYRAFCLHYIDGWPYEDIAQEMNAGKNSPARWCKDMNERLAVILFGVDGIRKW